MSAVVELPATLRNTVIYGDATTVLRGLPSGLAQTCVTSPPYWGLKDYGTRSWVGGDTGCDHEAHVVEEPSVWRGWDGTPIPSRSCARCGASFGQLGLEPTVEAYVGHLVGLFAEVGRVLREDGTLWVNLGDAYNAYGMRGPSRGLSARGDSSRPTWIGGGLTCPAVPDKSLIGLPWRLALALMANGWTLRNEIIWRKEGSMPERVIDRLPRAHESIFLFAKSKRCIFNRSDDLDTAWSIPPERGRGGHPAPYPRQLARWCIESGSNPGDVVLDPFAGSGSTLAAAVELGRSYIGVELNEAYRTMIEDRVESASERARMRAGLHAIGL